MVNTKKYLIAQHSVSATYKNLIIVESPGANTRLRKFRNPFLTFIYNQLHNICLILFNFKHCLFYICKFKNVNMQISLFTESWQRRNAAIFDRKSVTRRSKQDEIRDVAIWILQRYDWGKLATITVSTLSSDDFEYI